VTVNGWREARWVPGALAIAVLAVSMQGASAGARSGLPGFGRPVVLPGGGGHGEPSMVIDGAGRVYVSAIAGLPDSSPVWRSVDAGRSFTKQPSCSLGPEAAPLGGGDSALVLDKRDNLYGTDLWLADDSVWYSTDHASTCTGFPVSHRIIDDRNGLAYSPKDDAIYQVYDGLDGLWISRADLGTPAGPTAALSFAFNNQIVPADPACAAGSSPACQGSDSPYVRNDVNTPGGITVDQRTGTVYVSWSDQHGVAVARSADKGLTWTISHIPGTEVTGSDKDTNWNFVPIATESAGGLYAAWVQTHGSHSATPDGISMWAGMSRDGGQHWTKQRLPALATAVFPTLAVYSPGRVALGWMETNRVGDPNTFTGATWRLRYAEVAGLTTGRRTVAESTIDPSVHQGTLAVGDNLTGDRTMGDFLSMAVNPHGDLFAAYTRGPAPGTAVVVVLPRHQAR
jgi:hypothetical protein